MTESSTRTTSLRASRVTCEPRGWRITRNEDLYLVHRGRARFEFNSEHVDAPAGAFVFVPPGVKRTAFAEEPDVALLDSEGHNGGMTRRNRSAMFLAGAALRDGEHASTPAGRSPAGASAASVRSSQAR